MKLQNSDSVNKAKVSDMFSRKVGLTKQASRQFVNDILEICKELIAKDGKLVIQNFGTFAVKTRKPIVARNLKTMQKITVPETKTVSFRASKQLKKLVNDTNE